MLEVYHHCKPILPSPAEVNGSYFLLQALAKAKAGEIEVKLHVESVRELDRINYMQQGNDELYSMEMLGKVSHRLNKNKL